MPGIARRDAAPADWELTADRPRDGEKVGYMIILTVHDEVICEAPDEPEWNAAHLAGLLSEIPSWATGLPLAAAGFESKRYKKG